MKGRGVELFITLYEDKVCGMQHMKTTLIKREKKEEETGDYKWQMENPATSIHAYS